MYYPLGSKRQQLPGRTAENAHVSGTPGGESIVALAGGVGGAKFAQGLAGTDADLTVIVNTADDFTLWGLHISPDLDTVMYTLGGIANPATGWGVVDDTHATLEAIAGYGENPWFSLGDRDFATHILRTQRLRAGESLSSVTNRLAGALGIESTLLPMTDDPVATVIHSGGEMLDFQDYFVARRQQDTVDAVSFDGIGTARSAPGVLEAIANAAIIVYCPSNPIVSIGPILGVPGIKDALQESAAVKVGISPIVGGRALKGPADRMLASLGHEPSALGVARLYAGLLDVLVIDEADRALASAIEEIGYTVHVMQTVMGDRADRERLAAEVLAVVCTG
jgi:LPPG:FO 2-phospho-L-lactate transferase